MSKTRLLLAALVVVFISGCMHWAPISSVDDAAGACRVRVAADDRPPVVLERPTIAEVRALVSGAERARVEVRKVNAWATTLIAIPAFLASAFTGLVIFAGVVLAHAPVG